MKTKITLQTRRKFLRTSMLGAAATWTLPVFLEKTFFALDALAADAATQTVTGKDGTILVVLDLDRPRRGIFEISQEPMLHLKEILGRANTVE